VFQPPVGVDPVEWIAARLVRAVRTGSLSTLPDLQAVQRRHFVGTAVAMRALETARRELGEAPVYSLDSTTPRPPSAGDGVSTTARLDRGDGAGSVPATSQPARSGSRAVRSRTRSRSSGSAGAGAWQLALPGIDG